jgi:hypothetical protein
MATMTTLTDISSGLVLFEESAIRQADATEIGDYKKANKNYNNIIKAVDFIRDKKELLVLVPFLEHRNLGVRLWAATYLLPIREKFAIRTLEEISSGKGIHSLTAETTLDEWQKGNLSL